MRGVGCQFPGWHVDLEYCQDCVFYHRTENKCIHTTAKKCENCSRIEWLPKPWKDGEKYRCKAFRQIIENCPYWTDEKEVLQIVKDGYFKSIPWKQIRTAF